MTPVIEDDAKISKFTILEKLHEENPDIALAILEKIFELVFNDISTALVCGDRVELRGFCSMVVRKRQKKTARNPKTNTPIEIADKGSLYFRASRELLKQVNTDDLSA